MTWIRGKSALVTGANVGIGLETARGLASAGAHVIMTARDRARGEAAVADVKRSTGNEKVELLMLDLASRKSIESAADDVLRRPDSLPLLVNNAGLMLSDRRETEDGFEATFGINHLGPFLLTHRLLDRIRDSAPARIVNLSSEAHRRTPGLDFDDLMRTKRRYKGLEAYGDSKLANLLYTRELARHLSGSGVVTHAVHPGVVRTGFARDGDVRGLFPVLLSILRPVLLTPTQGAATSLHVAMEPDPATTTGEYWSRSRRAEPAPWGKDDAAAARLWDRSRQLWRLDA